MSQYINAKVQASRKELLDIGLRNNLISFKKSSKTLALQVENIAATFEALYVDEKLLIFEATKECPSAPSAARTDDEPTTADIADDALLEALAGQGQDANGRVKANERHSPLILKTSYSAKVAS